MCDRFEGYSCLHTQQTTQGIVLYRGTEAAGTSETPISLPSDTKNIGWYLSLLLIPPKIIEGSRLLH